MIKRIATWPEVNVYLEKHQLVKLFKKAVEKIKRGYNVGVDLKKREPKSKNKWSFRINKKYRAFARKDGEVLYVYEVDDHQ